MLLSDGSVLGVGKNNDGQLGVGENVTKSSASLVKDENSDNLSGIIKIASGFGHTLFLKSDGTVVTGRNTYGQLGDGTTLGKESLRKHQG